MQPVDLTYKKLITINDFLDYFKDSYSLNLKEVFTYNLNEKSTISSKRMTPIIELAKSKDAKEIVKIFKDYYKGTYPYKQMEDIKEIIRMIESPSDHWFLFKIHSNTIVGCFGTRMDLDAKTGNMFGFIIKKEFQKIIDVVDAFLRCTYFLWERYKNKILIWYGEMRTNDTASQHFTSLIGLKPIAFLPNKDIFFNKLESVVLHVVYDENLLQKLRSKKQPRIIRSALNCYTYSNNRYHLGIPIIENPKIELNQQQIKRIRKGIIKKNERNEFGFELIMFLLKDSTSYFKFIYNPYSKNCEKTNYKINKLEELFVFLDELKNLMSKSDIQYFECLVSSYKPSNQKIFYDFGFKPRGYIPCWKVKNKGKNFEDVILFNFCKEKTNNNAKLIPETIDLLNMINFPGRLEV